jgi:hypothetical protein
MSQENVDVICRGSGFQVDAPAEMVVELRSGKMPARAAFSITARHCERLDFPRSARVAKAGRRQETLQACEEGTRLTSFAKSCPSRAVVRA